MAYQFQEETTVGDALSQLPAGCDVQMWTGSAWSHNNWDGEYWDDEDQALIEGQAFFVKNTSSTNFTVTFTGTIDFGSNYISFTSNVVKYVALYRPVAGFLQTDFGYTPHTNDVIKRWTGSAWSTYTFDPETLEWDPTEPEVRVGEGFMVVPAQDNEWALLPITNATPVIGYTQIIVPSTNIENGWYLTSNPFKTVDNGIEFVIPPDTNFVPLGTYVYKYAPLAGSWDIAQLGTDGYGYPAWDQSWTLETGEGFGILNVTTNNLLLEFSGIVCTGNLTNHLYAGLNLVGSPVPVCMDLVTNMYYPVVNGDEVKFSWPGLGYITRTWSVDGWDGVYPTNVVSGVQPIVADGWWADVATETNWVWQFTIGD